MRYKVVQETSLEKLEKLINYYLDKGWSLAGGLVSDKNRAFYQAMTTHNMGIDEDE